jgi:hypothetical protein
MVHADDMLVANSSVTNSASGSTVVNYLAKMKTDTAHFATLEMAKFFSFCDRTRSDPFLISPGMPTKQAVAAGSGITAMYASNKHELLSRIYQTSHSNAPFYRKKMRGGNAQAGLTPTSDKIQIVYPQHLETRAKAW